MSAINHERKKLADSIIHISSEDQFKLLFDLMKIMYERRQFCIQAQVMKNSGNIDYIVDTLSFYNKKIKELILV